MASPTKLNLKIYQGSTFKETIRWESAVKVYIPITNISKAAPVVITAPAHNIPLGWRVKVTGVLGMKEINTDTYYPASQISTNSLSFNEVNSLNYSTYTGGGVLEYNQPVDLTGYTGRMQIRPKLDSETVLHELTTSNGGIIIDSDNKTIQLLIPASVTQTFTFNSGVYSLELVKGAEVTQLISGNVSLVREVTR